KNIFLHEKMLLFLYNKHYVYMALRIFPPWTRAWYKYAITLPLCAPYDLLNPLYIHYFSLFSYCLISNQLNSDLFLPEEEHCLYTFPFLLWTFFAIPLKIFIFRNNFSYRSKVLN